MKITVALYSSREAPSRLHPPVLARCAVDRGRDMRPRGRQLQHASCVIDMHQRQIGVRAKRNRDALAGAAAERFKDFRPPGRSRLARSRAHHGRNPERGKGKAPSTGQGLSIGLDVPFSGRIDIRTLRRRTLHADRASKHEALDAKHRRCLQQVYATHDVDPRGLHRIQPAGRRKQGRQVNGRIEACVPNRRSMALRSVTSQGLGERLSAPMKYRFSRRICAHTDRPRKPSAPVNRIKLRSSLVSVTV